MYGGFKKITTLGGFDGPGPSALAAHRKPFEAFKITATTMRAEAWVKSQTTCTEKQNGRKSEPDATVVNLVTCYQSDV